MTRPTYTSCYGDSTIQQVHCGLSGSLCSSALRIIITAVGHLQSDKIMICSLRMNSGLTMQGRRQGASICGVFHTLFSKRLHFVTFTLITKIVGLINLKVSIVINNCHNYRY